MKYSPGICNFLEEISSLSHSVVFLYSFALIFINHLLCAESGASHLPTPVLCASPHVSVQGCSCDRSLYPHDRSMTSWVMLGRIPSLLGYKDIRNNCCYDCFCNKINFLLNPVHSVILKSVVLLNRTICCITF